MCSSCVEYSKSGDMSDIARGLGLTAENLYSFVTVEAKMSFVR